MPSLIKKKAKQKICLTNCLIIFGYNITLCHGQFNNLIPFSDLPSKKYLEHLPSLHDIDLFCLNLDEFYLMQVCLQMHLSIHGLVLLVLKAFFKASRLAR